MYKEFNWKTIYAWCLVFFIDFRALFNSAVVSAAWHKDLKSFCNNRSMVTHFLKLRFVKLFIKQRWSQIFEQGPYTRYYWYLKGYSGVSLIHGLTHCELGNRLTGHEVSKQQFIFCITSNENGSLSIYSIFLLWFYVFFVILGPLCGEKIIVQSHMWGCAENNDTKQTKVNSF